MIRSIIEFFRKEAELSILDLTIDICSSSMYYFYIRKEKNLNTAKVNALKQVLGSDSLTEGEINQFSKEIDTILEACLLYQVSLNKFNEEVSLLLDYRKQAMLEEKLVINYLILLSYHAFLNNNVNYGQKYYYLLEELMPYMTNIQKIHTFSIGIIFKVYSKAKLFETLKEIDHLMNKESDQHLFGQFYFRMGNAYYLLRKEKQSMHFYQKALESYQSSNNFVGIIKVLNAISTIKLANQHDDSILKELFDIYQKAELLQNGQAIFVSLVNIIIAYSHLNDVNSVKKYFQKVITCLIEHSAHIVEEQPLIDLLAVLLLHEQIESLETLEKVTEGSRIVENDSIASKFFRGYKIKDIKERIKFFESKVIEDSLKSCNFGVCQTLLTAIDVYYNSNHQYKKQAMLKGKYISMLKEYYG